MNHDEVQKAYFENDGLDEHFGTSRYDFTI